MPSIDGGALSRIGHLTSTEQSLQRALTTLDGASPSALQRLTGRHGSREQRAGVVHEAVAQVRAGQVHLERIDDVVSLDPLHAMVLENQRLRNKGFSRPVLPNLVQAVKQAEEAGLAAAASIQTGGGYGDRSLRHARQAVDVALRRVADTRRSVTDLEGGRKAADVMEQVYSELAQMDANQIAARAQVAAATRRALGA